MRNLIHKTLDFVQQSRLHLAAFIVTIIWICIQIVLLICFWGAQQGSDQGMYLQIAFQSYMRNEWYPVKAHLYDVFIWAPGYINYLILQLRLFGTLNANSILNFLMNLGILAQIYLLAKQFFSERTALYSVILFCSLYSNLMVILTAGTEVPFMFLVLSSFTILVLNKRANHFMWMGLFLALANWIRPFIIIFLPIFIAYMLWKRFALARYLNLALGLVIGLILIGFYTQNQIGRFSFQSTTSGNNLIQTAHDKAYGGIMTNIASDTTGPMFIRNPERYTVFQKDSIWKARSYIWIKAHPCKYAYLYIKKWGGLYLEDSWADRPLTGQQGSFNAYVVNSVDRNILLHRFMWMGIKSITYYIILVLCLIGLWLNRKEIFKPKILLFLLLLMGTAANCFFVVGPRYHYPYMFVIVIFAADALQQLVCVKKKNKCDA